MTPKKSPVRKAAAPGEKLRRTADATGNSHIDYGPLENWVGFHLRLAQTASFQAFTQEAKGMELRPGRFATMLLIGRNPGISQTALSRANSRDKSTLSPVLDDLERRKLIRRVRPKNDRRSYHLMLTPSGEAMLKELTARAERHDKNLDRIIGRDRMVFLKVLRKIIAELS